jgi:hypothetical protein
MKSCIYCYDILEIMLGSSFYLEYKNCRCLPLSVLTEHRMYPSDMNHHKYVYQFYDLLRSYTWMAEYFEPDPNKIGTNDIDWVYRQAREEDIEAFTRVFRCDQNALEHESFVRGSVAPRLFRTHYSVGFSRVRVERHDLIFAVDGIRVPLILRKHDGASSGYRVVGECYLWAALELDYWNPGTRKGRWSSRPYDLGKVQTRMIEIY